MSVVKLHDVVAQKHGKAEADARDRRVTGSDEPDSGLESMFDTKPGPFARQMGGPDYPLKKFEPPMSRYVKEMEAYSEKVMAEEGREE